MLLQKYHFQLIFYHILSKIFTLIFLFVLYQKLLSSTILLFINSKAYFQKINEFIILNANLILEKISLL